MNNINLVKSLGLFDCISNEPVLATDQHSSFSVKHLKALVTTAYSVSDTVTYWLHRRELNKNRILFAIHFGHEIHVL